MLHFPQLTSEPPTSLAILIASVTAQDLSIEPLAARSDQPRLRLCLEVGVTPACAEAATARQLQRAMSGGPSLCVMQLGLAAAGPLVDGLRLADGPAHLPNREAPPVWLQWLGLGLGLGLANPSPSPSPSPNPNLTRVTAAPVPLILPHIPLPLTR